MFDGVHCDSSRLSSANCDGARMTPIRNDPGSQIERNGQRRWLATVVGAAAAAQRAFVLNVLHGESGKPLTGNAVPELRQPRLSCIRMLPCRLRQSSQSRQQRRLKGQLLNSQLASPDGACLVAFEPLGCWVQNGFACSGYMYCRRALRETIERRLCAHKHLPYFREESWLTSWN